MRKLIILLMITTAVAGVAGAADAQAGKPAYDKACKSCHGATGEPNAAIAKALKVEMRHLGSTEVQALTDAELKKIIKEGIGKMKPVKSLSDADVENVIAYMRTLKK
jgi:cytochrome c553